MHKNLLYGILRTTHTHTHAHTHTHTHTHTINSLIPLPRYTLQARLRQPVRSPSPSPIARVSPLLRMARRAVRVATPWLGLSGRSGGPSTRDVGSAAHATRTGGSMEDSNCPQSGVRSYYVCTYGLAIVHLCWHRKLMCCSWSQN